MKESIKVVRLVKSIEKLGKDIRKLSPSRYKSGLLRYHWSMTNSVRRLRATQP